MATYPDTAFSSLDYSLALFNKPKVNCVLMIDPTGTILQANNAFLLSFGYSAGDLIGKNFSMLFREEDRQLDLPGRELRTVLDEGQSFDNNFLVNKNRVQTWVSGESILISNEFNVKCILKIIQNIHTQKESEYSILRLNNFNENILSSIQDAVIVLNKDLKIVKANSSFTRLFHHSDPNIADLDFKQFITAFGENPDLYAIIAGTFASKECISQIQLELDAGNLGKRIFDISCSKLDTQDGQANILLVFHDITGLKNIEKQREDILNFVGHELRTPLTNLILNIDMMSELFKEKDFADFGAYLDKSRNSAKRLKKIINELNRTTKLISGNFDPESTFFDFEEMMEETIHSIRQTYPDQPIIKKGNTGVTIFADRDKLIQVVINYLTNAIKYAKDKSSIEVFTKIVSDSVIVAVKDEGIGIPAADLPHIFNRFYRAEKTKSLEGLGLGLFLCRQIILSHHGQAWVESEEGKGSTFYFSLPLTSPA